MIVTQTAIADRQEALDALYCETFPDPAPPSGQASGAAGSLNDVSDRELIEKAMRAANGAKFAALWRGDIDGYASHSDADAALCNLLVFWTAGDAERVDRLFRRSGLYREKWERADYRARTIARAMEGRTEFYTPRPVSSRASSNGHASSTTATATESPASAFPVLEPEALHGLAGAIVRAIDPHTEAHPAAVLLNALVYFGSAVTRAPHGAVGSKRHPLNLFTVYVGETSKGRKGTSMTEVDDLFGRVDPVWHDTRILSGLSSGEGLIYHVRDASDKKDKDGVPLDEGVRDKRLLVIEEEFAGVLKVASREGNTLSPVIRQAWDSGKLRNLTKNTPLHATGAHISVIGHITQMELRRLLTETESANGFGNRFLWVCTRRSKLLPDGGGVPSYGPIVQQLKEALDFGRTHAAPIVRDEEASTIWHAIYPLLSRETPGLVGAVTSRAEAQVLRLSVLYAVMDQSPAVRAPHLTAALALWRYCEASAQHVFGDAQGDPVADRILAALKEAGDDGLTATQINDLFKGKVTSSRLRAALDDLVDADIVAQHKERTDGAPRTTYTLA